MNIQTIKKAFKLIKEDKLLMVPYLIFFLLFQIAIINFPFKFTEETKLTLNILTVFFFIWLIELGLKSFIITSVCKKTLTTHKNEHPLLFTLYYFKHIVLGIFSIFIPILLTLKVISFLPTFIAPIAYLLSFFLVILGVIMTQLIPIIILSEKYTIKPAIQKALTVIKIYSKDISIFILTTIIILLITMFFSSLFSQLSIIGSDVLEVVVKAAGYTLQYIYATIYYLALTKKFLLSEENK